MNIFLDKTEPNRINDLYKFDVIAQVRDGKKAISNESVQFYLDAEKYESPLLTEGDGRAVKEFFLPPGIYTIFAEVSDGTRKKITIPVIKPKEEKMKPANITVNIRGDKGKYTLYIRITNEKEIGVPNTEIKIIETDQQQMTDSSGLSKIDVEFKEFSKSFQLIVLGTNLSKNIFLNGY